MTRLNSAGGFFFFFFQDFSKFLGFSEFYLNYLFIENVRRNLFEPVCSRKSVIRSILVLKRGKRHIDRNIAEYYNGSVVNIVVDTVTKDTYHLLNVS